MANSFVGGNNLDYTTAIYFLSADILIGSY